MSTSLVVISDFVEVGNSSVFETLFGQLLVIGDLRAHKPSVCRPAVNKDSPAVSIVAAELLCSDFGLCHFLAPLCKCVYITSNRSCEQAFLHFSCCGKHACTLLWRCRRPARQPSLQTSYCTRNSGSSCRSRLLCSCRNLRACDYARASQRHML